MVKIKIPIIYQSKFSKIGVKLLNIKTNLTGKLFFVIPNYEYGGTERVVYLLQKHLQENSAVISLAPNPGKYPYQNFSILGSNIVYHKSIFRFLDFIYLQVRILFLLLKNKNSCFLTFGEKPNLLFSIPLSILIAKLRGNKIIGNVRNTESVFLKHSLKGRIQLYLMKLLYPGFDGLTANSVGAARDLKDNIGLRKEVKILYNPVQLDNRNLKEFNSNTSTEKVFRILHIGRFNQQKGQDIMVDIFKKLTQKINNIPLRLCFLGSGDLFEEIKQKAFDLGVEDMIEMPGLVKDVGSYMEKSDLYVLSSRWEGQPNSLLEAMAYGLPVVAFDCPSGVSDILSNQKYGILVPNGDRENLFKKIEEVIHSDTFRKNLAEGAKQGALPFAAENSAKLWEKYIGEVFA